VRVAGFGTAAVANSESPRGHPLLPGTTVPHSARLVRRALPCITVGAGAGEPGGQVGQAKTQDFAPLAHDRIASAGGPWRNTPCACAGSPMCRWQRGDDSPDGAATLRRVGVQPLGPLVAAVDAALFAVRSSAGTQSRSGTEGTAPTSAFATAAVLVPEARVAPSAAPSVCVTVTVSNSDVPSPPRGSFGPEYRRAAARQLRPRVPRRRREAASAPSTAAPPRGSFGPEYRRAAARQLRPRVPPRRARQLRPRVPTAPPRRLAAHPARIQRQNPRTAMEDSQT
jgi:hypothetical protein